MPVLGAVDCMLSEMACKWKNCSKCSKRLWIRSRMSRDIRKLKDNFGSIAEVWLFIRILLLLTALPGMIRLLSFGRVLNVLTFRPLGTQRHVDPQRSRERIVKFTDYILSRNFWIYRESCLKRSLVLYYFLREIGMDIHICFGIKYRKNLSKRGSKKLDGHAWLLYDGEPFLERNTELTKSYTLTYCFPDTL